MDYLIISPAALGLFMIPSLGKRTAVGKIYYSIADCKLKEVGKNLNLVPGWEKLEVVFDPWPVIAKHTPENLTIVIEDVGVGPLADHLKKMGFAVIGASEITDRLEDDRTLATEYMSKFMKVPETTMFTSFRDGINWLKSQDKTAKFVFKPHDGLVPKDMTYVSQNVPDLLTAIETFKSNWQWKEEFQLQKKIDGVLVDFGGWFNGKSWLPDSHYVYFENKPFLTGDKGPATGGEIAVVTYLENKGVFYDILTKLTPILTKFDYRGQISVNSMVAEDDKQPYFLELTPRFGYPSFPQDITLLEANGKELHDLFTALREQKETRLFAINKPSTVIIVSSPPYPNTDGQEKTKGLPFSWDKKWDEYFYPYHFMYDEKKKSFVFTGTSMPMIDVTCAGSNIPDAVHMTYETYIPTMKLKNMQYRTDLGDDAKVRLKKLHEWKLV